MVSPLLAVQEKQEESLKQKTFVQNAGLFLVSILLTIAIVEILLHLVVPSSQKPKALAHQLSDNPVLFYEPIPGASIEAYGILNRINKDGFRDREFSINKPEGVKRIVFLGDSVIYGYGLSEKASIPKQLESAFAKNKQTVEVLNFGVSGYDTQQEVEFLKVKGLKYKPDIVLVGFVLNDNRYASWELDLLRENYDSLAKISISPGKQILAFLFEHSRILQLLNKRFHIQKRVNELQGYPLLAEYLETKYKAAQDKPGSEYALLESAIENKGKEAGTSADSMLYFMHGIGFKNDNPIYSSHWSLTYQALQELKRLSEENHFQVIMLVFPIVQEMEHYPLGPLHEFLNRKFQSFGFRTIDLQHFCNELYRKYGRPALSSDGIHFSPLGSAELGRYLYRELSKNEQTA